MTTPKPGFPVRGSISGRPIMALLDLLGRRMCLRILWELRAGRVLRFRALQDAADTNPAVLNARLGELKEVSIVALEPDGYRLTDEGIRLAELLLPMNAWAEDWATSLAETSGRGAT